MTTIDVNSWSGSNESHQRFRQFAHFVALPTMIGALIYLLFRSQDILVFSWLKTFGLYDAMIHVRDYTRYVHVPAFVRFALPDGLWVFASTSWIILIWDGRPPWYWLGAGLALGIGSEAGQEFSIVPGEYHPLDVLFYVMGFMLACLQLRRSHEKTFFFSRCNARHDGPRLWQHGREQRQ